MDRRRIARVHDHRLTPLDADGGALPDVAIGSDGWFAWLDQPRQASFSYAGPTGSSTARLAMFDGLDGSVDWPLGPDGAYPLTGLLLADYLVLDLSKPYAEDSFLEIERAALAGRPHRTCGGRSLNDDVMDTLYTLLVNGGRDPTIRDGVDGPTRPASRTFRYLAPLNLVGPNPAATNLVGPSIPVGVPG